MDDARNESPQDGGSRPALRLRVKSTWLVIAGAALIPVMLAVGYHLWWMGDARLAHSSEPAPFITQAPIFIRDARTIYEEATI